MKRIVKQKSHRLQLSFFDAKDRQGVLCFIPRTAYMQNVKSVFFFDLLFRTVIQDTIEGNNRYRLIKNECLFVTCRLPPKKSNGKDDFI